MLEYCRTRALSAPAQKCCQLVLLKNSHQHRAHVRARSCTMAAESNVPSDVTSWVAKSAVFNTDVSKRGKQSKISDEDNSVVERLNPEDTLENCVVYTLSPLPLDQVWQITVLNATKRRSLGPVSGCVVV